MATSDKHCQTYSEKNSKIVTVPDKAALDYAEVMYDETVAVVNAREIESPPDSDEEKVADAMAKFTPPARPLTRHDFDSDSDTGSEPERFVKSIPDDLSMESKLRGSDSRVSELSKQSSKESSKIGRTLSRQQTKMDSSENSDSDSNELALPRPTAASASRRAPAPPLEGAYDPEQYRDLRAPPEMEELFQYIMKYTPQKVEIEYKLQPFVPDYVPAVGDIDAFIKVTNPACDARGDALSEKTLEHIDNLGLIVLDEPAAEQSDSALLHLQLRALTKTNSAKSTVLTKKIENAEKNPKSIERWIRDVSELHLSKPAPNVNYTNKMPDIESLMQEWPSSVEQLLNSSGFPPATLDCSLQEYAGLVCAMFDVPVAGDTLEDSIQALHVLFSLYLAVRSSQLYAERMKEDKGESETA